MGGLSTAHVAVVGGGVVGCAVAHALARHGVEALLLEAQDDLALGASGANSGILHTGFDSVAGELETELILRSAAMREQLLGELGVVAWRCGARLQPRGEEERGAVAALARNAEQNGVQARLEADGALRVAGESITDPVDFVRALAGAAVAGGARMRLGSRVVTIRPEGDGSLVVGLERGEAVCARAVVNCAGLFADEVARAAGEELLEVYPRKGEFLVFAQPPGGSLEEILLPVPSALGKGVLVFPTLDDSVIAGPTAREREDKGDWSVEADADGLIMAKAILAHPPLARAQPIGAYAGLRPAGRGCNYVIEPSPALPGLVHVAAIRSTGLSASLAIGAHVVGMLARAGRIEPGPERPLRAPARQREAGTWWQRAALRSAGEQPRRSESG